MGEGWLYKDDMVGHKLCPVCGCRFQGSLDRHWNDEVQAGSTIARCDWRLIEFRITRRARQIREQDWRPAGSVGARVAQILQAEAPHLVLQATSGVFPIKITDMYKDPANDPACWYLKRWVVPLAHVSAWPMRKRAQLIIELESNPEALQLIEATERVGGAQALDALEGVAIPARCPSSIGDPQLAVLRPIYKTGDIRPDRCVLAVGHLGLHKGLKTGVRWDQNGDIPSEQNLVDHELAQLFDKPDDSHWP